MSEITITEGMDRPTIPTKKVVFAAVPRWLRMTEASSYCGLSRSALYEMLGGGAIKSVCLRRRGALRGIRLVDRESINAFLESQLAEQEQEITTEAE